jgi:hypothetical protein
MLKPKYVVLSSYVFRFVAGLQLGHRGQRSTCSTVNSDIVFLDILTVYTLTH